jgi:hypothetical protein
VVVRLINASTRGGGVEKLRQWGVEKWGVEKWGVEK